MNQLAPLARRDAAVLTTNNILIRDGKVAARGEFDKPADAKVFDPEEAVHRVAKGLHRYEVQVDRQIRGATTRRSRWFTATLVFSAIGAISIITGVGLAVGGLVGPGVASGGMGAALESIWGFFLRMDKSLATEADKGLSHARELANLKARLTLDDL